MQNLISKERFDNVVELLNSSAPLAFTVVAERTGVGVEAVRRIADGTHKRQGGTRSPRRRKKRPLSGRRDKKPIASCQPPYMPTPEEITQVCAEIRSTWNNEEERLVGWTPALVSERVLLGD